MSLIAGAGYSLVGGAGVSAVCNAGFAGSDTVSNAGSNNYFRHPLSYIRNRMIPIEKSGCKKFPREADSGVRRGWVYTRRSSKPFR